jgi:hypothetical protein
MDGHIIGSRLNYFSAGGRHEPYQGYPGHIIHSRIIDWLRTGSQTHTATRCTAGVYTG